MRWRILGTEVVKRLCVKEKLQCVERTYVCILAFFNEAHPRCHWNTGRVKKKLRAVGKISDLRLS